MGSLSLPLYVLLPAFLATAFLLWVLWKFWEEERRHGTHSRDSESSRLLRISYLSRSPLDDGSLYLRQQARGSLKVQRPAAASSAALAGRN